VVFDASSGLIGLDSLVSLAHTLRLGNDDRLRVGWPQGFLQSAGEVSRGEKMTLSEIDPEPYITEYTQVYEDKISRIRVLVLTSGAASTGTTCTVAVVLNAPDHEKPYRKVRFLSLSTNFSPSLSRSLSPPLSITLPCSLSLPQGLVLLSNTTVDSGNPT
jgi:hypothetical protein